MSGFTAEDFARATLAMRGDYGVARRTDPRDTHQWYAYGGEPGWFSDEEMAADGWTPVVESRITLDGLAGAWEAAEVPTDDAPMRQGDVYISTVDRNDRGLGYLVAAAGTNGTHMHFNARILSRAPRAPWVELAGVLHDVINQGGDDRTDVDSVAARLYAEGVRVTGGDE